MRVVRLRDADEVARRASAATAEIGREALARRGRFTVALAGGNTPREMYRLLSADASLDWSKVEFFFGDERCVPPEHPDSNYAMARAELLDPLGIDALRIHRIAGERSDPAAAARDYEGELAEIVGGAPGGPPPPLDLVLLGMGADGHTLSLFPNTAALSESRRWFVANEVPRLGVRRITATFALLESARAVFILISGESKAAPLSEVLEGPWDPERFPSQRLRVRASRVDWYVDAAAASRLRDQQPEA